MLIMGLLLKSKNKNEHKKNIKKRKHENWRQNCGTIKNALCRTQCNILILRNREENKREKIALPIRRARIQYTHTHTHNSIHTRVSISAIRQCEWSNHKETWIKIGHFLRTPFANLSVCLLLAMTLCLSLLRSHAESLSLSQSIIIRIRSRDIFSIDWTGHLMQLNWIEFFYLHWYSSNSFRNKV